MLHQNSRATPDQSQKMICLTDSKFSQRYVTSWPSGDATLGRTSLRAWDKSGTNVDRHLENLGIYHNLGRILNPEVLPGSVWTREKDGGSNGDTWCLFSAGTRQTNGEE